MRQVVAKKLVCRKRENKKIRITTEKNRQLVVMLTSFQQHEIESLIKSNKIVVIERDHDNHKIRLFDESTTTQSETFGRRRRRERDSSSGSAPSCSCANTTDFDLMHLFELYGIDMSKVTRVSLRENVARGDQDDNDDDLIVRYEEFILQRYLEANMTPLKVKLIINLTHY